MNETSDIVALRQPDEIDDPLTNILRAGARQLLTQAKEPIGGLQALDRWNRDFGSCRQIVLRPAQESAGSLNSPRRGKRGEAAPEDLSGNLAVQRKRRSQATALRS